MAAGTGEETVLFADSLLAWDLPLDPRLELPSLSPPLPVPEFPDFAVPELVLDAVEWQDLQWLK